MDVSGPYDSRDLDAQQRYAWVLLRGTRLGLGLLIVTFGVYVLGVIAPHVPVEQLPQLWTQPASAYLQATQQSGGWSWFANAGKADVMSALGIVVLSAWSAACLLAIVPVFAKQRDRVFVALCVAEVVVLVLAASNVLNAGH